MVNTTSGCSRVSRWQGAGGTLTMGQANGEPTGSMEPFIRNDQAALVKFEN